MIASRRNPLVKTNMEDLQAEAVTTPAGSSLDDLTPDKITEDATTTAEDSAPDFDDLDLDAVTELLNDIATGEIEIIPPTAEETKAEETPEEPEAEAPAEPEEKPAEPVNTEKEEDEEEKRKTIRLRPRTEVGERMLQLVKSNPYMTEIEAMEQAKTELGIETPKPAATEPEAAKPTEEAPMEPKAEGEPGTATEAQAEILRLKTEALAARGEWDTEKEIELEKQALELEAKLPELRESEAKQRQQAAQQNEKAEAQFDKTWSESLAIATDAYPDSNTEGTAMYDEMLRLDNEIKESDPDLWVRPDKPLILAQKAALNLRIAPNFEKPKIENPVKSGTLPSAAARVPSANGVGTANAQPASNADAPKAQTFDEMLESIESLDDLYEMQAAGMMKLNS